MLLKIPGKKENTRFHAAEITEKWSYFHSDRQDLVYINIQH